MKEVGEQGKEAGVRGEGEEGKGMGDGDEIPPCLPPHQ